jgi:predicted nuclease of predicted toxin-antitoxin system
VGRYLVDESMPRAVTRALVAAGHDTTDVRDIGLRGATDAEVARRAAAEQRIVVAADLDFANALRFAPGTHPGMVVTRLPASWTPAAVAARLVAVLQEGSDLTLDGAITIVEVDRVRVFSTPSKP